MKALMSVGALIGVIGLLLLVGMIFDIVPANTVRLVEGYMPMQMLFELTLFVAGFAGISYMMSLNGNAVPAILAGYRFLGVHSPVSQVPGLSSDSVQRPRHVWDGLAHRRVHVGVANEEDWKKFKQPIMNVLDAQTGGNKMLRYAYLVLLPILIGGFSYNAMKPKSEEPIELRTVHPAPPASTKVHGKTYVLANVAESVSRQSRREVRSGIYECQHRGTGHGPVDEAECQSLG